MEIDMDVVHEVQGKGLNCTYQEINEKDIGCFLIPSLE